MCITMSALRGNPLKDALRPEPQERFSLHSHAERGNDEGEFREVNFDQILSVPKFYLT